MKKGVKMKPKCKPWDIVKGRRFECCHQKVKDGHNRRCMEAWVEEEIPKTGSMEGFDLYSEIQMREINNRLA